MEKGLCVPHVEEGGLNTARPLTDQSVLRRAHALRIRLHGGIFPHPQLSNHSSPPATRHPHHPPRP